jgi:hypothetical protein
MRHRERALMLNRCVSLPLGAFLLGTIPACSAQTKLPTTPSTIYERTHLSVVVIVTADKDANPTGQGSGFIVAKDKIVTNHHVVDGASSAVVIFADGSSAEVAGIVADSPTMDLAILSVKTGVRSALRLGDELSIRQGDAIFALGAPRGLELSITNGIVSGFRRVDEEFLIQNTAPIAPGSSGGPLFDSAGRVVGVTTFLLNDSPGIYFSIGSGDVSRLLRAPNLVVTPFSVWAKANAPDPNPTHAPVAPVAPAARPEPPPQGSLFVTSNPPSAAVFVNGIKQPGQTPVTLSLSPGQYNLVLRLPGYSPYVGSVNVSEGSTQIDAELSQEFVEDLSGTYRGTVHNSTAGISATFSISIRQHTTVLSGCMTVLRPLYGSGYLNGTVEGNAVSFLTTSPMFQISFHGKRTGKKIIGTYTVARQPVEIGEFDLEKSSSEGTAFDLNKCPTDYSH